MDQVFLLQLSRANGQLVVDALKLYRDTLKNGARLNYSTAVNVRIAADEAEADKLIKYASEIIKGM